MSGGRPERASADPVEGPGGPPSVVAGPDAVAEELVTSGAGARRQALWTTVSQVLSSLANFGLTIAVARAVDEVVGGAFTYAFLIFSLGIGVTRAVTTDPLIIRFSAVQGEQRRRAITRAAGATTAVGVLVGLVCVLAGVVVGGELGLALGMLLVVLPGQFLQDCWRSAAFVSAKPRAAALNDAVRVLVQFAAIAACAISGTDNLVWLMLSWAAGAWAGAVLGIVQFGRLAGPRNALTWLKDNAGLSIRLGSDYAINMGVSTLVVTLLVALLGLAATGGLRFAQSILGPINVFFGAVISFAFPLMARRLAQSGPRPLFKLGLAVSGLCFGVAALAVGVLVVLPDSVGVQLLGRSWDGAQEVMLAVGGAQSAIAISIGGALVLKSLNRPDLLLRSTAIQAPLILCLGVGGGLWAGIAGAAWGMAAAQFVGALLVLAFSRRGTAA